MVCLGNICKNTLYKEAKDDDDDDNNNNNNNNNKSERSVNFHINLHVTRRMHMEQKGSHYFSLAQTHLMY
jgi:hypothetical protein